MALRYNTYRNIFNEAPVEEYRYAIERMKEQYQSNRSAALQNEQYLSQIALMEGDQDIANNLTARANDVISSIAEEGNWEHAGNKIAQLARETLSDRDLAMAMKSKENYDKALDMNRQLIAAGRKPLWFTDPSKHKTISENGYSIFEASPEGQLDYDSRIQKLWSDVQKDGGSLGLTQAEWGLLKTGNWQGISQDKITRLQDEMMRRYQTTNEYDQEKRKLMYYGNMSAEEADSEIQQHVLDTGMSRVFGISSNKYMANPMLPYMFSNSEKKQGPKIEGVAYPYGSTSYGIGTDNTSMQQKGKALSKAKSDLAAAESTGSPSAVATAQRSLENAQNSYESAIQLSDVAERSAGIGDDFWDTQLQDWTKAKALKSSRAPENSTERQALHLLSGLQMEDFKGLVRGYTDIESVADGLLQGQDFYNSSIKEAVKNKVINRLDELRSDKLDFGMTSDPYEKYHDALKNNLNGLSEGNIEDVAVNTVDYFNEDGTDFKFDERIKDNIKGLLVGNTVSLQNSEGELSEETIPKESTVKYAGSFGGHPRFVVEWDDDGSSKGGIYTYNGSDQSIKQSLRDMNLRVMNSSDVSEAVESRAAREYADLETNGQVTALGHVMFGASTPENLTAPVLLHTQDSAQGKISHYALPSVNNGTLSLSIKSFLDPGTGEKPKYFGNELIATNPGELSAALGRRMAAASFQVPETTNYATMFNFNAQN